MTTNKQLIEKEITKMGFVLGCYDEKMNNLSKKELNKVLLNIDEEFTDIEVTINRKKHIVEVETVDNEKDLFLLTKEQYTAKYGNNK